MGSASDIEFAQLKHKGKVKDFALAGALDNGLQIIDISNPSAPALTGRYDCGISQGDVQVFTRGSRTLATYTMDAGYTLQEDSQCVREAKALGLFEPTTPHPLDIDPIGAIAPDAAYGRAGIGTYIVDITDPTKPIELQKLEKQIELSKTTGDSTKPVELSRLPKLPPGASADLGEQTMKSPPAPTPGLAWPVPPLLLRPGRPRAVPPAPQRRRTAGH